MKTKFHLAKQLLSIILCLSMVLSYLPIVAAAADSTDGSGFNRVVDASTMDNWEKYFDLDDLTTVNAGGVWTDKSVFTDTDAFPDSVTMIDGEKNFLTALSALAANKEIVGYSTIPTDTVLVLDLSGSMSNSGSQETLVKAANDAIKKLLETNKNNRVGVVLYSASGSTGSSTYAQSVTRILPIDRYTAGTSGNYLSYRNNTVSVAGGVSGTNVSADLGKSKSFNGGTYIQAGLWEAKKMFEEMDTVIDDNNWQSGDNRMPILVLMSDGACSTGTSYYDDVENSKYTTYRRVEGGRDRWEEVEVSGSNVGNGNESNLTAGNAFLTQLTASYVMNQIEAHYRKNDAQVRGLFYTLGFNISGNSVATAVMNPDSSSLTDELWSAYNNMTSGTLSVRVKDRNGDTSSVSISKNSYVTSKSYVDEYFPASANGLSSAFTSLVNEIILQSRYYPTHLEGGSPDFSGYVEFEDIIGEYMEVKHITGILLGETLFDGHMMASKLSSSSDDGLGTPENPTELGDEFIRAVKERLGISSTAEAQALVANAWQAKQLYYNASTGEYSNYIGWYAKSDMSFTGFWDESSADAAPADAVYKIKSYGFLGETSGSIKNSDMMYMSVQVRTNIATGQQTVMWKVPASLVPMVTYLVTLDGSNVDTATNVNIEVENADSVSPIRLLFESGLRADLNELNITRITDSKHIADDNVSRQFWTNYFDITAAEHDDHITTLSEFTPSKENERFYYTFDSAVHKLVGGNYVLVGSGEILDENGEYYHRRYIFTEESNTPIFFYEKMSSNSVKVAKANGWVADFETLDGETGAYVVPAGTPARELDMYEEIKSVNATDSAHMVFYPYLT
ncbi:MAG: VWA domain-containing protein, partial [Clostridia bacterium]|nr:VWA domain-containing protein [Clostridia bacterium]